MENKLIRSKYFLYLTEFFAGMSVMAVELGASRLMAPYFSSSQIVWTVIIGVIMIAMAIGNVWGGKLADRSATPDKLYRRLIVAAIWIALIPFVGRYLIAGISLLLALFVTKNFLVWAALAACLVIFAFPCVLLGTVTPSLTRFTVDNLDDTGKTVGRLNALNTIGSIIGTFVPTFVTIPAVGTAATFLIFSGVLAAIGIAGMDRLLQRNVLALSGRAVEAAGDVDVLLLDKTGTITLGNRMASAFLPLPGVNIDEMMQAACLASSGDETPEGRSIVELGNTLGVSLNGVPQDVVSVPFTAETRMSGVDAAGEQLRKGATDSVLQWVHSLGLPERREELKALVDPVAREGGTPLVVASSTRGVLGVIQLKDVVKPGMRDRFDRIRAMGIKTVMITGDNRLTAQAIAAEAGVDDFLAEAKPEDKLQLILDLQKEGRLVAMSGDGTNDAPALAKSDVGLVMNTGTQAAREAGNMIDLDSDPTKLIEIVEIGKQLLITRGALTTFSLANDVAKYFAIIPALFMAALPELGVLNVMHLSTPQSAILSAVIFNALIIILLIPLALKGVCYRPRCTASVLRGNLLVYGLGGVIAPFIGIKLIDIVISAVGLV